MKKQQILINYSGSGVKTLKGFAIFFFIIAFIAMIVAILDCFLSFSLSFFITPILLFVGGAICIGLSSIAKTALYKRMLLENQYQFVEFLEEPNKTPKSIIETIQNNEEISDEEWERLKSMNN
ncbi:MAG: hypothetical protein FWC39_02910 [Bacteroidetes bacterium]|nr:hypothetical protein [Bacteroidota bacterium]